MIETWKDVKGYERLYQISNLGRLKSFHKCIEGRIRKFDQRDGGYLNVDLYKNGDGTKKMSTIHQLVAEHFVEGCEEGLIVNHIDGDKHNCVSSNLEWVTYKENDNHAIRLGLKNVKGSHNPAAKLTESIVLEIRTAKKNGISCKDLYPKYKDTGMTYGSFRVTYYGGNWKYITVQ